MKKEKQVVDTTTKAQSELKQAEDSLHQNEEMYRLLVTNLPDTSVFLFDHNLRFILAEGYLHPEFAFTTTQLEGKTLWEVLPPDRAEQLALLYRNVLDGKPTENFISEFKENIYSVNISPVKNKQGEIVAGMIVSRDITESKRKEELLQSNYSLLRIAGKTAKFGGWSIDLANNRVTWSDQVAAIHEMPAGYSPNLNEGINFYAPEWRETITICVSECAENGTSFDRELEIMTAKGRRIWVRTAGEAVRNDKGEIVKLQGSFQDITERKKVEEDLRKSEKRWRKLVNTIPDYVALYDHEGKYLFLNHFAEGFSQKDIEGKTYRDFMPGDAAGTYEKAFELAKNTRTTQYLEYTAFGDNYTFRDYESYMIPIFENDVLVNTMVIARDITDHKRAEAEILKSKQQYDNLVSKIPVGVYILRTKPDDTFALEYASPKMAEMLDLSVESLLAHHETIFKAIHPDDLEDFSRLNMNGIRQKQPFDWKGRIVVKGGEKWLHISSMPQQVENGEVLWHGLIVDITKRMHDEAEIKLKNEELQNLNATKDKFFSIIAHDLKSPFNSIVGFSGLLVELVQENNFDGIREYTKIVHESASQAMDLLMNLLEWSRSQTGRMTFKPVVSDMSSLINNATELFGDSARLKSITIRTELPTDSMVLVDQIMMGTVLRNLISNAIKFTRPGGQILVSAEQREGEWLVSVSDNGIGIKKDDVKKLFRLEENYTTLGTNNEKGTGLGLILCKEFVEKHGGKIWVESEEGNGSTFSFTIPLS